MPQHQQEGMQLGRTHAQALDATARAWCCWRAPARTWASTACAGRTSAWPTRPRPARGAWRTSSTSAARAVAAVSTARGLGEFFLDDLGATRRAWSVPTPGRAGAAAQRCWACRRRRTSGACTRRALQPGELTLADRNTSNRTSGSIETLAAASGADDHRVTARQAQAWLLLEGLRATTLRLGPLTRLGGRMRQGQCGLRRPSHREALRRPHRDGDGRLGVRTGCSAAG